MDSKKLVSVVIPSYNRAHILRKTIPSYAQPEVGEIIVVDDCSTDNTLEVLEGLKAEIPILRIFHNKQNRKQTYSKNRGIHHARFPFIYFGDDDSFITDGTIGVLLSYALEKPNALISAKPLYMDNMAQMKNIERFIKSKSVLDARMQPFFDVNYMRACWDIRYTELTKDFFVHACFLLPTEMARKVRFDIRYGGNALREETDYITQMHRKLGAESYFAPGAYQINLPRNQATGGAHIGSRWKRKKDCIVNTAYYLRKHYRYLKKQGIVKHSYFRIMLRYIVTILHG